MEIRPDMYIYIYIPFIFSVFFLDAYTSTTLHTHTHTHTDTYIYIFINIPAYIYIYNPFTFSVFFLDTYTCTTLYTHTHPHVYIYIYIYIGDEFAFFSCFYMNRQFSPFLPLFRFLLYLFPYSSLPFQSPDFSCKLQHGFSQSNFSRNLFWISAEIINRNSNAWNAETATRSFALVTPAKLMF